MKLCAITLSWLSTAGGFACLGYAVSNRDTNALVAALGFTFAAVILFAALVVLEEKR